MEGPIIFRLSKLKDLLKFEPQKKGEALAAIRPNKFA